MFFLVRKATIKKIVHVLLLNMEVFTSLSEANDICQVLEDDWELEDVVVPLEKLVNR